MHFEATTDFEIFVLFCAALFAPILAFTKISSLYHKNVARHDNSKYRFNNLRLILFYLTISAFAYFFCMDQHLRIGFGIRLIVGLALLGLYGLIKYVRSTFQKR